MIKYYLQDKSYYHGNLMNWWAKDGKGYTANLDNAHQFTADELAKMTLRPTDVAWLCSYIDGKTSRCVNASYCNYDEMNTHLNMLDLENHVIDEFKRTVEVLELDLTELQFGFLKSNISQAIRHVAFQFKSNWISIDDDTPKVKGRYLCYFPKSDKQAIEPFMLDDMLSNKEYMKALGISHWQPTPQNPPQE